MFCCDNNSNMKKCNCKNEALKTLRRLNWRNQKNYFTKF